MEIPIENLKAKMRGVELNNYQKGLANRTQLQENNHWRG